MAKSGKIKVMIASTVYGFQDQLSAIVGQLMTLGYEVVNSHNGSMKVNPKLSNLENCLKAVDDCDIFLGIIRPYYGSGNIGALNITFEEIKKAIELRKPYWFLVHRDVVFAKQLFKFIECESSNGFSLKKNKIFDIRTIDIYDYVIVRDVPQVELRTGNWAQEFYRLDEAMTYINAQFGDKEFIKELIEQAREDGE